MPLTSTKLVEEGRTDDVTDDDVERARERCSAVLHGWKPRSCLVWWQRLRRTPSASACRRHLPQTKIGRKSGHRPFRLYMFLSTSRLGTYLYTSTRVSR